MALIAREWNRRGGLLQGGSSGGRLHFDTKSQISKLIFSTLKALEAIPFGGNFTKGLEIPQKGREARAALAH